MMPRTALIVGAGIGGLAAALALRRAGWRVRVHEQADGARSPGFAVGLAPNGIAALDELGLADAVGSAGARLRKVELRHPDGRVIRTLNAQVGGPSIVALRPALHGVLLRAIEHDVGFDCEVVSFVDNGDEVTLQLKNGSTEHGALLVGADGVHSVVRRCLHSDEPRPQSTGFCAVRGLAPAGADRLGPLAAIGYLGHGVEAAVARASDDAVYWYLSLLTKHAAIDTREAHTIAVRQMASFEPCFREIVASTPIDAMRFDELFHRPALSRWGAGRVTLLGDAAHPLLPHTAQGAAQALEDAVALGLAMSNDPDVQHGLRRYEQVRSRRTRRFVLLGPRLARMTTTTNPIVKTVRTLMMRLVPERALISLASLDSRDPHRALRTRAAVAVDG